jgi:UDP-N-acetylglucosamine--N-acetylmuramyl-(pentapeptide) pyrophosphoryl-undecaprenol N-acetylglucosamine transferase
MARVRGLLLIPLSAIDAWSIISRRSPDLVIGVGGYSSGPVVLMAALRRIPTLLLEQNAVPGMTNRLLAPAVSAAAVSFEATATYFGRRAIVAGNPVRSEFVSDNAAAEVRTPGPPRILIFGGSQGAHAINVAMVEAAPQLATHPGGLAITHQTGERDLELVRDGYRRAGIEARVEPFLFAMDREIKAADLVVCRAGATTIAELTTAGRPAVLVPLPTAADDHQRKNAEVLGVAGAAEVVEQKDLQGGALAVRILALVNAPDRLASMASAARTLARPDAVKVIADKAIELIGKSA